VSEKQEIYVVWTNTDLTEGRGKQIPIAYSVSMRCALRLAKGKGVMGSDADVRSFTADLRNGYVCAPVQLVEPTKKDIDLDDNDARRQSAIDKALQLGVSEDELKLIMG
jgi:hypothetical protein